MVRFLEELAVKQSMIMTCVEQQGILESMSLSFGDIPRLWDKDTTKCMP